MNNRHFPMHGDVNISVDGRLMVIDGTGPANIEAVQEYQQLALLYRPQLSAGSWASLVRLKGEPFLTPEGKQLLIDTINFACTQNLVATAIVVNDLKHQTTVELFWRSIYEETPLAHAFFETENDARDWLMQQIAFADADDN